MKQVLSEMWQVFKHTPVLKEKVIILSIFFISMFISFILVFLEYYIYSVIVLIIGNLIVWYPILTGRYK